MLATWDGVLNIPQLQATTFITRDDKGFTHIKATNYHDAYFAQGFAQAQNRMAQIELTRRNVQGRLSEWLGPNMLTTDKAMLTLSMYRHATIEWANIQLNRPKDASYFTDFANGINYVITTYASRIAQLPEFAATGMFPRNHTEIDAIAIYRYLGIQLNHQKYEERKTALLLAGMPISRINQLYPTNFKKSTLSLRDMGLTHLHKYQIDAIEEAHEDDSCTYGYQSARSLNTKNVFNNGFNPELYKIIINNMKGIKKVIDWEGSNSFVISGKYTKSKKPVLENDPHLSLSAPSTVSMVYFDVNGFKSQGAEIPGTPGLTFGLNDHISWGVTNSVVDTIDYRYLFESTVDCVLGYTHNGIFKPYTIIPVTIPVKGLSTPVNYTIYWADDYGPKYNQFWGVSIPIVYNWRPFMGEIGMSAAYLLGIHRSKSIRRYAYRASNIITPNIAITIADHHNIGFMVMGKSPIRVRGNSGRIMSYGDGRCDWQGDIPFEETYKLNSRRGYYANSNNRITPRGWQYTFGFSYHQNRNAEIVKEIDALINSSKKITHTDVRNIQLSTKSIIFDDFKFLLNDLNISSEYPASEWLDDVKSWDGYTSTGQVPSIFELWRKSLYNITGGKICNKWFLMDMYKNDNDPFCLAVGSCVTAASKIFNDTFNKLTTLYGSIPTWSTNVHKALFPHPIFDSTPYKVYASKSVYKGGGTATPNYGGYVDYNTFNYKLGPVYRQISTINGKESNEFIIPLGNSGCFYSPFYANNLASWAAGINVIIEPTGYDVLYNVTLVK